MGMGSGMTAEHTSPATLHHRRLRFLSVDQYEKDAATDGVRSRQPPGVPELSGAGELKWGETWETGPYGLFVSSKRMVRY